MNVIDDLENRKLRLRFGNRIGLAGIKLYVEWFGGRFVAGHCEDLSDESARSDLKTNHQPDPHDLHPQFRMRMLKVK